MNSFLGAPLTHSKMGYPRSSGVSRPLPVDKFVLAASKKNPHDGGMAWHAQNFSRTAWFCQPVGVKLNILV
jgi:hypothetical protein